MNARASGTPAKLEATPEKVISAAPRMLGSPPRITAYASRKPKIPPMIAVTRLISMLAWKAPMMRRVGQVGVVLERELALSRVWKLPLTR